MSSSTSTSHDVSPEGRGRGTEAGFPRPRSPSTPAQCCWERRESETKPRSLSSSLSTIRNSILQETMSSIPEKRANPEAGDDDSLDKYSIYKGLYGQQFDFSPGEASVRFPSQNPKTDIVSTVSGSAPRKTPSPKDHGCGSILKTDILVNTVGKEGQSRPIPPATW